MATTAQHLAARSDSDLLQRLIAAAEIAGIKNAQTWAATNLGQLISVEVDGEQCIADVHAYADTIRAQALASIPPPPGIDPAAVTDTHLSTAVAAVRDDTAA